MSVLGVVMIRSEWQQRAVGDFVRAAQRGHLGGLLDIKERAERQRFHVDKGGRHGVSTFGA